MTAMRSIDGAIAYCLPLTKMSNLAGSPIERVEVLALGPDLPRHAYTGHLPAPYTTSTLVKITDADGVHGLGSSTRTRTARSTWPRSRLSVPSRPG